MLRNAFDLLAEGGGQPAAAPSKSKKKNKKKGSVAVIGEPIVDQQSSAAKAPEPQPVQSVKDAGEALEAAAAAAGAGELGSLAADWAEQVRAHTASKPCQQPASQHVPSGSPLTHPACCAARSWCVAMQCSLMARPSWSLGRQAGWVLDPPPAAAEQPAHTAASDYCMHGSLASCAPATLRLVVTQNTAVPCQPPTCRSLGLAPQVLLRGRALEALLESACARGSPASDAQPLAQLLGDLAHASVPGGFAAVLADAAASLGQLAAVDPLAPTPAGKRAVCAALGLLKRGIPRPPQAAATEAPAAKLRRLASELGRQVGGGRRALACPAAWYVTNDLGPVLPDEAPRGCWERTMLQTAGLRRVLPPALP